MKKISLIVALAFSSSVFANDPVDATELSQFEIQDAGVLNGSSFDSVNTAERIEKGQILVGQAGLEAYTASGEVVVKLASFADANKLAKAHNLTLKQAYKDFYIITSSVNDLNQVLAALKKDGTVVSASIDLRDLGVGVE
ncbi:hypothetical protein PALB_26120 [Pseudoalteromonas luteoviolacea B = ATCC 29581]|nr:hypothetical protein PALB_26120 [Pseudoalteromonas luteoviolacea B = ATCC 29581]